MIQFRHEAGEFMLKMYAVNDVMYTVDASLAKAVVRMNEFVSDLLGQLVAPCQLIPHIDYDAEDLKDNLEFVCTRAAVMGFKVTFVVSENEDSFTTIPCKDVNQDIQKVVDACTHGSFLYSIELVNRYKGTTTFVNYCPASENNLVEWCKVTINDGHNVVSADGKSIAEMKQRLCASLMQVALEEAGEILKTELHRREA